MKISVTKVIVVKSEQKIVGYLRLFAILFFSYDSSLRCVTLFRLTGDIDEECNLHSVPRTHSHYMLVAQKKIEVLRKNDNFKIREM